MVYISILIIVIVSKLTCPSVCLPMCNVKYIPQCSANTRHLIWQYINTYYMYIHVYVCVCMLSPHYATHNTILAVHSALEDLEACFHACRNDSGSFW